MNISPSINWTVSAAGGGGGAPPNWFTSLPYSQWVQVGSNSMGSVSSINNYGLTDAWVGAAVDQQTRKFCIGNPGGHQDPGENSMFEFLLNEPVPYWRRTRAGGGGYATSQAYNGAGVYADGQPAHCHSYHRPVIAQGRFWLPTLDSFAGLDGPWTTATFSYDLSQTSNGVWTSHGRLSSSVGGWGNMGSACYDPVTDRIFSFGGGGGGFYFNATNAINAGNVVFPNVVTGSTSISNPSSASNCALVMNNRRLLVMTLSDPSSSNLLTRPLDNLNTGWTYRTTSGNWTFGVRYGGGWVYHESAQRLYSYNSGGNSIRVIDVPAVTTDTWPGRTVTLGGVTAPSSQNSGAYSRFNIVQDMGNGEACLIYYPRYNYVGALVCRVPAGGL